MTSATDNRTTKLESLSKLKMAGRLHYWRGTIEIPETQLHAICDEIQAEYDNAVHALNKAAGNWAKADAELREKGKAMTDADYHGYEQAAIEAWENVKAWNTRAKLGSDALTAEQVRDAVMSADRWEKPMGDTGLTNTHLIIRDDGWQAIADELNERAERTCEYVVEDNMNETEGMGDVWFRCTNCDMCFDYADDWLLKMPYCPNCGAKVVTT